MDKNLFASSVRESPEDFLKSFEAMLTGFWLTDLANASAMLYQYLQPANWVGFYLSNDSELRLGPFVGKPACTQIAFSRGVCDLDAPIVNRFSEKEAILVEQALKILASKMEPDLGFPIQKLS